MHDLCSCFEVSSARACKFVELVLLCANQIVHAVCFAREFVQSAHLSDAFLLHVRMMRFGSE